MIAIEGTEGLAAEIIDDTHVLLKIIVLQQMDIYCLDFCGMKKYVKNAKIALYVKTRWLRAFAWTNPQRNG